MQYSLNYLEVSRFIWILVVNVSHVCPYTKPQMPQQTVTAPLPIKIGEFEYKVEQILNSQLYHGKLQYLVKWLEYMEEHNMWEPLSNPYKDENHPMGWIWCSVNYMRNSSL